MNLRHTALSLLLLLSLNTFAQNDIHGLKTETKLSFLDSIKASFVQDEIASCVDSLWMKELTNLDLFNEVSDDIEKMNIEEKILDDKLDLELPTSLLKQRLAEMDAKSPFNIEYNQGLENVIKSYLKNRKKSFGRLMAISEYYFPIFEEAMAKQNVPLEIKYLAVVESALNPKAVSRMGATGLWQFMYQTGKQYDLDISTYVDERSDPLKSSDAAATYMSNMYRIFGDWDLVLASYNSGPGNVAKAIRRSGGHQNYWNIRKKLPMETQGYVPAFLATMYIYEYHKEHGIVPNRAPVKLFETDTVRVKQQISFKQISDLLDVSVAQIQLLNPSYKRDIIPFISGENHFLRLPNNKISVYTSNEDKIYAYTQHVEDGREKPFGSVIASRDESKRNSSRTVPGIKYYKIKQGDNLGTIANEYNVSVSNIKKWNNLSGNNIAIGNRLKIVTEERIAASIKKEDKKEKVVIVVSKEKDADEDQAESTVYSSEPYVVKKGDNLSIISNKYHTTIEEIKEWNGLTDNNIQLGSKLIVSKKEVIPAKEIIAEKSTKRDKLTSASKTNLEHYSVQKGDSLYSIAKKYPGVTISDLRKWNGVSAKDLKPGMKLKING